MRDSQHGGQEGRGVSGLSGLARTVVARLLARDGPLDRGVDDAMVAALADSLLDPDPAVLDGLRQDLRRARISDIDLADRYFPEVARHMGCAWAEDRAAFTDVTIAVARMQTLLREIGRDWSSNAVSDPAATTVLLVLPEGEQHSFGPMLMAGQLRRQGISVRIEVGTAPEDLIALVRDRTFDCAMISVACEEKLDQCRDLVRALRRGSDGGLWIAIGGALLDRGLDVCARTGADIATCDPFVALQGAGTRPAKVKEVTG